MRSTWYGSASMAAIVIAATMGVAACNTESTNAPPDLDAEVRISNQTNGPVLFVHIRRCGSGNWGSDLLGELERIEIGQEKVFDVESGCMDLRAQYLENPLESPIVVKIRENVSIPQDGSFTWVLNPDEPGTT